MRKAEVQAGVKLLTLARRGTQFKITQQPNGDWLSGCGLRWSQVIVVDYLEVWRSNERGVATCLKED